MVNHNLTKNDKSHTLEKIGHNLTRNEFIYGILNLRLHEVRSFKEKKGYSQQEPIWMCLQFSTDQGSP